MIGWVRMMDDTLDVELMRVETKTFKITVNMNSLGYYYTQFHDKKLNETVTNCKVLKRT